MKFISERNTGFMLNVTDQYCISSATNKGGFSCHPGDFFTKMSFMSRVTEARYRASFRALQDSQKHETMMAARFRCWMLAICQSLLLFLGLT